MSEYQLELKQLVDYPRCRIYREFIRSLITDPSIRLSHHAGLFHYTVLCCHANFRTSYQRIDGISYIIRPGEWLCRASEMMSWFRLRFKHQLISLLEDMQTRHLIIFSLLGRGNLIKFSITNWHRFNRVLDYNAPCQKETGFFFLPISIANEIIGYSKCSEMDVLLDLWINAVYNDSLVLGSDQGPVVYLRNGTGSPLVSYAELAERWGLSKSTVGRYLQKFRDMELITLFTFSGTHGTAIYLRNYLITMFDISDVMLDKDEVSMALNVKVILPDEPIEDSGIGLSASVAESNFTVSKSEVDPIVQIVQKILAAQGVSCAACSHLQYKLLPLSKECRSVIHFEERIREAPPIDRLLELYCENGKVLFRFEIHLWKGGSQ